MKKEIKQLAKELNAQLIFPESMGQWLMILPNKKTIYIAAGQKEQSMEDYVDLNVVLQHTSDVEYLRTVAIGMARGL